MQYVIAFYLCRHTAARHINASACSYKRWSAVRIKVVEPFKRMTEEIFQGEVEEEKRCGSLGFLFIIIFASILNYKTKNIRE